jgi:hypothetical protein
LIFLKQIILDAVDQKWKRIAIVIAFFQAAWFLSGCAHSPGVQTVYKLEVPTGPKEIFVYEQAPGVVPPVPLFGGDGEADTKPVLSPPHQTVQGTSQQDSTSQGPSRTAQPELIAGDQWSFDFDSRQWKLANRVDGPKEFVREYVLMEETLDNWSELITSYSINASLSARISYDNLRDALSRECPSLRISIIEESPNNIVFEWEHDGCQAYPAQHEIRRITNINSGTRALSFTAKLPNLSAEKREVWLGIIKAAQIKAEKQ